MNKKPCFTIPFVCFLAMLTIIMIQGITNVVKMRPLDGFTQGVRKEKLSLKTYLDGTYQAYLTRMAKQHTGFREFFIRSYNQMAYSCFDKITNNNIVKGYNDELYMTMYLNDITGKKLIEIYGSVDNAKVEAEKNVEATLTLIDTLRQHGTEFIFVFCPSKTGVYPEFMPKEYQEQIADFQLVEYYIELFKEKGIPHIDFYHYFQQIKDEFPYPLYTKTGTHWAESTLPFVCDSIFRKIEEVTGYQMPSIEIQGLNITNEYSIQDGELEGMLNLLFPLRKPAVPKPVFALKDTVGKDRPNLLVVGDSYYVQMRRNCFSKAFNNWDHWAYNKDLYSSRPYYNGKHMNQIFDANEVIEDADIVIAMFTTAYLTRSYMCGFIPFALQQLQNGGNNDEEAIALIIQDIKNTPEWYQSVAKQAEQHGITIEESLRNNAEYLLQARKQAKQEMSN